MSRQCRSGRLEPRDLAGRGVEKWETRATGSTPGLGRGCGSLGKGAKGDPATAPSLSLEAGDLEVHVSPEGRHEPCPEEGTQSSWENRDITAPTMATSCPSHIPNKSRGSAPSLQVSQHGEAQGPDP